MSTAVILAGGLSSRMGFDKQQLIFNDELLLKKQIIILSDLFDHIIIVSNNHKSHMFLEYAKVSIYKDIIKGCGPLSGIHAGLTYSHDEFIYVIACDMPYINCEYIKYMQLQLKHQEGIVTRYGDWIEPFHAFYNRSLIKDIEDYLRSGKRSIYKLLGGKNITYISEETARTFSEDWSLFDNINTKQDLNNNSVI